MPATLSRQAHRKHGPLSHKAGARGWKPLPPKPLGHNVADA